MLSPSISIVLKDTVFDETEGSYSMRILVPISSPRRQISLLFTASLDSRDADWSWGPTRRYKIFHSLGQLAHGKISQQVNLCVSSGDSSALPDVPEGDGVHGEAESSLRKGRCPIVQRPSASKARELLAGSKYFDSEDEAPIMPAKQSL